MSDSVSPQPRADEVASHAARAFAFAQCWSLEATRPSPTEIRALGALLGRRAIYLSTPPTQSHGEQIETAALLRAEGLEPVPHIAARRIADAAELATLLRGLHNKGDVRQALIIGGDVEPAGPFDSALDVIKSGVLQDCGLEEIGIAGYPDGHPRIAEAVLEGALHEKLERAGLRVHIVTQFSFDPEAIVAWLVRLRRKRIAVPVKVGMAGPTSLKTLLNYARRCGVKASARGLLQRPGILGALVGEHDPQSFIQALLGAPDEVGEISPHFFSFGGVMKTAEFAHAAAQNSFAAD
jgi:methylenetetrahydrofolate reductase (NADPH)